MPELARLVDDDGLGSRLETAYGRMTKVLALTIPERETIIRALDDTPPGTKAGNHAGATQPGNPRRCAGPGCLRRSPAQGVRQVGNARDEGRDLVRSVLKAFAGASRAVVVCERAYDSNLAAEAGT